MTLHFRLLHLFSFLLLASLVDLARIEFRDKVLFNKLFSLLVDFIHLHFEVCIDGLMVRDSHIRHALILS